MRNGGWVPFPRHPGRNLWADFPLSQPGIEVTRVERNTESLLNHPRQTGCGPSGGGKAKLLRRVPQPTQYRSALAGC